MQSKKEIFEEHFKQIKGYDNYLISDRGRVFNFKFKKFLKPWKDRGGYLFVGLCKNGVHKHYLHRLVALAYIPNPENKPTVNHIDGIKTNNFVENLEWNTQKENVRHSWDNGLSKPTCVKGIKNGRAKLSEEQVLEIRKLYKTGDYYQKDLAKIFDITQPLIGYIVNRKIWQHI